MTFGYSCNLNYKDEDLFSFELIIHVSTVANGLKIALHEKESSEFADERSLLIYPVLMIISLF